MYLQQQEPAYFEQLWTKYIWYDKAETCVFSGQLGWAILMGCDFI